MYASSPMEKEDDNVLVMLEGDDTERSCLVMCRTEQEEWGHCERSLRT